MNKLIMKKVSVLTNGRQLQSINSRPGSADTVVPIELSHEFDIIMMSTNASKEKHN